MKSVTPLRGVIFDLDGTLADTLPVCYTAFRATFRRFSPEKADFSDSEIAALFGPNEEGVLRQVVPEAQWAAALATFLGEYAAAHTACPRPFAGIESALDLLRERGVPIAVVTGKGAESAAISLETLGLADRFAIVEAGSPLGGIKPQAIRGVLEAWNLPRDQYGTIAYVGDAPSDITAAREVGIVPVAAAWATTADAGKLDSLNPAVTFHTVAAFAQWVRDSLPVNP